jgi:hypothetical protein
MKKNIRPHTILFLKHVFTTYDCTAEERQSIGRAICDNTELAAAFLEMKNIYNRLNTERYEPSQTSLDIIMQHVSSVVHQ